jgi:serine O-acetyltransferase
MKSNIEKHSFAEFRNIWNKDKNRFKHNWGMGKRASKPLLLMFRLGNYLTTKDDFLSKLLLIIISTIYYLYRVYIGVDILIGTNIGEGINMPHPLGIVISSEAIIGKSCTIHQNVTIGSNVIGKNTGVPVIGDNVIIYAGAAICGNVKIGNNVIVGANSVVTKNIPDNCIVAGIPAKIITEDAYSKMDDYVKKMYCVTKV